MSKPIGVIPDLAYQAPFSWLRKRIAARGLANTDRLGVC